jgi:hypothetical protein
MKLFNIAKMIPAVAFILSTTGALASNGMLPDIVIKKIDGAKKVSVAINDLKRDATINFLDQKGSTLASEVIDAGMKPAVKVFNLKNLLAGSYSFVVSTGSKETIQPVTITKDDIFVEEELRQVYLVPTIKIGDDYVDVSWLNGRISDMNVEIRDTQGRTIFEDELNNVLKVERRYNIEQLERGDYTMIVSTPFKKYYQRLKVD